MAKKIPVSMIPNDNGGRPLIRIQVCKSIGTNTPETNWVAHDTVWNIPLGELFGSLGNGRLTIFDAQGFGGTNPCLVVDFLTVGDAEAWWKFINTGEK
jgi:hypothetical protein